MAQFQWHLRHPSPHVLSFTIQSWLIWPCYFSNLFTLQLFENPSLLLYHIRLFIFTLYVVCSVCVLYADMCVDAHASVLVWSLRWMVGVFPSHIPPSVFLRQDFPVNLKSISLMKLANLDLQWSTYLCLSVLAPLACYTGPQRSFSRHFTMWAISP